MSMASKVDPQQVRAWHAARFNEVVALVERNAQATQTLAERTWENGESLHVLYGPIPTLKAPQESHLVFQVAWYGLVEREWPDRLESMPHPAVRTESPKVGKMVLWLFNTFEEAAVLAQEYFGVTVDEPVMQ